MCNEILNKKPNVIGFDTETTVPTSAYRGQRMIEVSLIQMYLPDNSVYLFQIYSDFDALRESPSRLETILTSRSIIKVGVDITNDAKRIKQALDIEMCGFIDIQDLAVTLGLGARSMSELSSHFLTINKSKSTLGNYDFELTDEQIEYAANDAKLSLRLYRSMVLGTTTHTTTNDSKYEHNLDAWITAELRAAVTPRKYKSMINQICNAYSPWKLKYGDAERMTRAKDALDSYIQRGKWKYNPANGTFVI
jgi:ribonuclease D